MPPPSSNASVRTFAWVMWLPGGTLRVTHTLPPMTEPRPMVMRPEDRRPGVDHDVVFDDRMPRRAFHQRAVVVLVEPLGAQRHRLVEPHALADDRTTRR